MKKLSGECGARGRQRPQPLLTPSRGRSLRERERERETNNHRLETDNNQGERSAWGLEKKEEEVAFFCVPHFPFSFFLPLSFDPYMHSCNPQKAMRKKNMEREVVSDGI